MNLNNNSVMAYILKANALILVSILNLITVGYKSFFYIYVTRFDNILWQLEKFELARDVILTGLEVDASR